jgi:hypothetical protein
MCDLTSPVVDFPLWMLTGLDRTLHSRREQRVRSMCVGTDTRVSKAGTGASGPVLVVSGVNLTVKGSLSIVGIGRRRLNVEDTWSHRSDQMLGHLHPVILTSAFGQCAKAPPLSITTLFRWGLYKSVLACSCSHSWPFALPIHSCEPSQHSLTHLA